MVAGTQGAVPAVECRSLEVRYGQRVAVDGLSFAMSRGEVLAILGPNGAGKTSTVETLEGYRAPERRSRSGCSDSTREETTGRS